MGYSNFGLRMPMPRPVLLAVVGLILFVAPAVAQPARPQGPPAVGVLQAALQPVTESAEFVGRIEATDRVEVRARVTGFIQERPFREGQEVKLGDVLYRLERPPFETEVSRARANVASVEAELANARVALGRAQELVRSGAGTRVTLDNAIAQERTASAGLLGAQAQLRSAEISLAYTEITSPIAGKIGRTNFTLGNTVGPDSGSLATIVSQDPMRVAFPISQRKALELRERYESRGGVDAVRVRVRLADGSTYPHPGRIEFIDNQIDRNTDTILIRALLPNSQRPGQNDRDLIDGQFVNVFVEGVEPVQAVVIPRAAVLQDQQGSYVFVVDVAQKAQRANVTLGRALGDMVVIERGLEAGQVLIAEGIQRVRPGQEVSAAPVNTPTAPRPGPMEPGAQRGQIAPNSSPSPVEPARDSELKQTKRD